MLQKYFTKSVGSFKAQLLRVGFLSTAFLPALGIEETAVLALPGIALVADLHVIGEGTFLVGVVMTGEKISDTLERRHGGGDVDEELLPLGHFLGGFLGRVSAKVTALWGPQSGGTGDGSPGELLM